MAAPSGVRDHCWTTQVQGVFGSRSSVIDVRLVDCASLDVLRMLVHGTGVSLLHSEPSSSRFLHLWYLVVFFGFRVRSPQRRRKKPSAHGFLRPLTPTTATSGSVIPFCRPGQQLHHRGAMVALDVLAKDLPCLAPCAVDGAREAGGVTPSWQGGFSAAVTAEPGS